MILVCGAIATAKDYRDRFSVGRFFSDSVLFFLKQNVGVEGVWGKVYVVFDFGVEDLAGQVAVVIATDRVGGGQVLDGVVVIVLFGVFVPVFVGGIAPD